MKIARSPFFLVLMSSLLVTGLDPIQKTDVDSPSLPPPMVAYSSTDDVTDDSTHADDKQRSADTENVQTHQIDETAKPRDQNEERNTAKLPENVISQKSIGDGSSSMDNQEGHKTSPNSPSSSVISDKSPKTGRTKDTADTPSKSKVHRQSSPPKLKEDTSSSEQPSQLSQLSKSERAKVLKSLESTFLNIVGLKSRPRPDKTVTIPQYMLDLYQRHMESHQGRKAESRKKRGLHNSNTIRSFFHEDGKDDLPDNTVHLVFNVTSLPVQEELQAAELRLYREASNYDNQQHLFSNTSSPEKNESVDRLLQHKHRIDVFQVMQPGRKGQEAITRLLDTRVVDPRNSRWESFDLSIALASWQQGLSNHGIEVKFSKVTGESSPLRHVRLKRSLDSTSVNEDEIANKDWDNKKPFLVTFSKDKHKSDNEHRAKRDVSKKQKESRGKRASKKKGRKRRKDRPRQDRDYRRNCRRRTLYVDFRDVGWTDWIVAPPGYDAFYCHGECPFHLADHFNTTNHAIVQQFVHSVDSQAVPKPCCVPTKLGEVSLLYVDEESKVVLRRYEEMVVEACGCR